MYKFKAIRFFRDSCFFLKNNFPTKFSGNNNVNISQG